MFKRNHQELKFNIILEDRNMTIGDIIFENVLPSPYELINDIINLKVDLKIYTKHDLLKLSDKDWKYYNELKNVDDNFTLSIIKCSSNDIMKYVGFNVNLQGIMCEFVNPKNYI